jgi:hypothetical protein
MFQIYKISTQLIIDPMIILFQNPGIHHYTGYDYDVYELQSYPAVKID